jgi:hypothetical protein
VDRLLHCLLEEAQASAKTITAALQLIALFADHAQQEHLSALARGPYGRELLRLIAEVYRKSASTDTDVDMAFAVVAAAREPESYWLSPGGLHELEHQISNAEDDEVILALMTAVGLWWTNVTVRMAVAPAPQLLLAEKHLHSHNVGLVSIAAWAVSIGYRHHREHARQPTAVTLDRLLALWLAPNTRVVHDNIAMALDAMIGLPRNSWTPLLTDDQIAQVNVLGASPYAPGMYDNSSAAVVAFHAKTIWSDREVAKRLAALREDATETELELIARSLGELGAAGRRYLRKKKKGGKPPPTLER